jgi:hypothetical protein
MMLDYSLHERKAIEENVCALRKDIEYGRVNPQLQKKLQSWADKYGFEPELIKNKVLTDDLFVLFFVVEPKRQTLHQTVACNYIRALPGVSEFQLLPSGGDDAKYVHGGLVVAGKEMNQNTSSHTKSIDFQWVYTNFFGDRIDCFATHKFTKEGGGSQDNQFSDIQGFLKQAQSHSGKKFFFAICDGDYYRMPYKQSLTRVDYLNANYIGGRNRALTINQLESFMNETL